MGLIVVRLDHLPVYLLGPYGNTSVPTPTMDSWAAQGVTVDAAFQAGSGAMRWGPAGQCAAIGGNSLGPQDADLWITPSEIADVFFYGGGESAAEQRRQIPVQPSPSPVRQWEDSTMARYLEAALSQLAAASLPDHPYVWLDLPLFSGPWDAPVEWRSYLAGEDSPELYQGVAPPACRLSGPAVFGLDAEHGFEPDQRMAWEHAAGSMVMLLDHGLEWLEKALAAIESVSPWTKVLTSCSGFSLGEHQAIGHAADSVWIEETQVPLLISWGHADSYPLRIPGAQAVADWWPLLKQWTLQPMATNLTKSGSLVSARPAEPGSPATGAVTLGSETGTPGPDSRPLPATERDPAGFWLEHSLAGHDWLSAGRSVRGQRPIVTSGSLEQWAVRTNAWSFVWTLGQEPRLFVRPDDRFEQNDVTSRCQQIVAIFQWFFLDLLSLGSYRVEPIPTRLREEWLAACRELRREGRVGDPWPAYDTLGMVEPGGELDSRLQQIPEDLWTRPG